MLGVPYEEPGIPEVFTEELLTPGVMVEERVVPEQDVVLEQQFVDEAVPETVQEPAAVIEEPVVKQEVLIPEEIPEPKIEFTVPPPPEPMPFEQPGMPPGFAGLIGLLAGFAVILNILSLATAVFFLLCLFFIAKKLDVPNAWLAFIPIVNIWIVIKSAGLQWWWILVLIFVPIPLMFLVLLGPAMFFIVFLAILALYSYPWMLITENLGKSRWLGLLVLLPVIQLVWLGILAFSKTENKAAPMAV